MRMKYTHEEHTCRAVVLNGGDLLTRRHLVMSGGNFDCPNMRYAAGIYWIEARDATTFYHE